MSTILLLHGLPGRGDQWERVGKALAPHRILAPTLDGFGDGWGEKAFPRTSHHAQQIIDFVAAVDASDLVSVAWSFSCHPLLLALSQGLFCRKAILFDPSSDTYLEATDRECFREDSIAAFGPLFAEIGEAEDRRLAQLSFTATGSLDAWVDLDETQRELFIGSAAALRSALMGDASPEALTLKALARINSPVLVASGENSRKMFKLAASRLGSILPCARSIAVQDADHLWPISSPEAFAILIKEEIGAAC